MAGDPDPPPTVPPPGEMPPWLQAFLQSQATQHQQFLAQQQQILETLSLRGSDPPPSPTPGPSTKLKPLSVPKLSSPETLSIPLFRDWKQRWEDYAEVQQLSARPPATQQSILRSALDPEWTLLWSSSRIPVTSSLGDQEIITLMEQYLRERRNPLLDRQEFHRRDQAPGESIDRYYSALKVLDEACAHEEDIRCGTCTALCTGTCSNDDCDSQLPLYHHLQETRIRDRLICGLHDKEMRTKILAEQHTTTISLERVLAICTSIEQSKTADANLRAATPATELHATSKQSSYKRQQTSKSIQPASTSSSSTNAQSATASFPRNWLRGQFPPNTCLRCGQQTKHNPPDTCPALDKTCTYPDCKKVGHVIDVCSTRLRRESAPTQNAVAVMPLTSSTPYTYQLMNTFTTNRLPSLSISTQINRRRHSVPWLPDSGAELDAIDFYSIEALGPDAVRSISAIKIEAVGSNGISLGPVGTIYLTLRHNNREYSTTAGVFKHLSRPLLSKQGCVALGLLQENWPHIETPVSTVQAISQISPSPPTEPDTTPSFEGIKAAIISDYTAAFDDSTLRPMAGPPMSIELIEGAVPFKRYRHNNIPYHWRDEVKQQLDDMVTKGIIEPVPVGEAIDWCHPMVVVPKKNSHEPRLTIDLTKLNQFVRRPAYPMRTPREIIARIPPGQKYFSTLDARHGYWQVPLDVASRKLTTFITPWGCYRYLRNVMGLISAGDEHNRRGDEALHGIPNVEKIVEDILIYDKELHAHISRVRQVIQRCLEHGITLNLKKFYFAESTAQWCGYQINEHGYTPAPHLIEALRHFPVPTSKTDVRSFSGLVQQFEPFSHRISELAAPLRALLPASACFTWTQAHQAAFQQLIDELTSSRVLAHFHPGQPLRLETDAAQSKGLGFALWQQQSDRTWRLIQAGSRFVSPTESRYSATEVEFLAVVWAVKKCRLFLLGHPFELLVDHRPLISIINSKTLDEIDNPRLLRFKEKIGMYLIQATWRAGSKHTVVDVLSRHPVLPATASETIDIDIDPAQIFSTSFSDPITKDRFISDSTISGILQSANSCPTYNKLISHVLNGFPGKTNLDDDLAPFWKIREGLTVLDGLVFWGSRIIIPAKLRRHILSVLHSSHQGHQRTLRRAQQAVFWPGISNDIKNVVNTCRSCQSYLPSSPKEPLLSDPPPCYPFQEVGTDLFSYAGHEYLIMVDRYSGWITVCKLGNQTTTHHIIMILKQFMTDTGIPAVLRSDNGPQFASLEFKEFAQHWGIQLKPSSPHYPQSNGLAESAVKTIKHLLAKTSTSGDITCDAFRLGLLELRNTPRENGQSPAQLLFGHPLRTLLPLHHSRFCSEWNQRRKECEEKAVQIRQRAKESYDSRAQPLPPFKLGDTVLLQNTTTKRWDLLGEIIDVVNERSYLIRTEAGRVLRRNRRFLRIYHEPPTETSSPTMPAEPPALPRRSPRNHLSSYLGFPFKGGVDMGQSSLSHNNNDRDIENPQVGARRDNNASGAEESG